MRLLDLAFQNKLNLFKFLVLSLCCFSVYSHVVYADNNTLQTAKGTYYRYYDNQGVATVSKSVTDIHIRRGYEVLDRNMYVISKVPPYNVESDLKKQSQRAAITEKNRKDEQLKRSYRNVAHAKQRKEEMLKMIDKQIQTQYQQMRQLQSDRNTYLQQRSNFVLSKQAVPAQLNTNLENNELLIKNTRNTIEQLKNTYSQQEQQFDYIISRLQTME